MNPGVFLQLSSDGVSPWWQLLLVGMGWTLAVASGAAVVALLIGTCAGVARTCENVWWRRAATAYVEVFRSIPLIVQFFLWYFVLPELCPSLKDVVLTADPTRVQLVMAICCLGLFTGARVAEQVRAGIQTLASGQRNAAYALGLTQMQSYRYVLMPVVYRMIITPLTSEAMSLVKNTSVAYSIGLAELFFRTLDMGETTFRHFEAFVAGACGYMAVAMTIVFVMGRAERKYALMGSMGKRTA